MVTLSPRQEQMDTQQVLKVRNISQWLKTEAPLHRQKCHRTL